MGVGEMDTVFSADLCMIFENSNVTVRQFLRESLSLNLADLANAIQKIECFIYHMTSRLGRNKINKPLFLYRLSSIT